MASFGAFWRLTGAGWALIRADALIPREIEPLLPPSAKLAGRLLRLFSGSAARRGRPGERLANVLEKQGPAAIKMGQFLSTRADIFGAAFAEDLSHLKDRLPAFPLAVAKAEIERNLGKPLGEIYAEIGDRPIIALGLRWLADNLPSPVEPVLNHGDYRLGNLLCEQGELTGVLDWELAHFGDPHEDLAFGCMAVWRFANYAQPALGLGSLQDYFAAYEAESGRRVDPARFRFWSVYRTVWWALGCLRQAQVWRDGQDRMLERVVISRRTSENELDLLMLLEEDAPEAEQSTQLQPISSHEHLGEAREGELAQAISEWLETIKPLMTGHDKFQLAVARNALGMIARKDLHLPPDMEDEALSKAILAGARDLNEPGLLARLRQAVVEKVTIDVPKYPALAVARAKWTGES